MVLAKLALLIPLIGWQQPLQSYVNHNRVLLIFEATSPNKLQAQQFEALSHDAAGMKERDLIVIPVPLTGKDGNPLELRKRFQIKPQQFTVILLGKDGGEKLRQHTPITFQHLAETIDAMPMRQEEMRHKQ